MKNKNTPKYSRSQKNAYHSGQGYAVARQGKKIVFTSEDVKKQFFCRL